MGEGGFRAEDAEDAETSLRRFQTGPAIQLDRWNWGSAGFERVSPLCGLRVLCAIFPGSGAGAGRSCRSS
jgi:hypothetical protein